MRARNRTVITVEIRKARGQDSELIIDIQRELRRPSRPRYCHEEFLIAWDGSEAVGCAATSVIEDWGYFYALGVRRAWQRQGIGSQLMKARLDGLRARQTKHAVALAMFWNSRFFRKHGFAPVRRADLPPPVFAFHDLNDLAYRRSAVMARNLKEL
jgi:N-acetylglutamate synthase-like GNAT family acetyltransferase